MSVPVEQQVREITDGYSRYIANEAIRAAGRSVSQEIEIERLRQSRDGLLRQVADLQARVNELEAGEDAKEIRIGAPPAS